MTAMMQSAPRYWRVWRACLRNCLARELEFRSSFILMSVSTLFSAIFSIVLAAQVFANVQQVAGWDFDRMFVLTGSFLIVRGLCSGLQQPNMQKLSELVNKGELDFVLAQPISSQFLVSIRYVNFGALLTAVVGVAYVLIGIARLGLTPGALAVSAYVVTLTCAFFSIYALWFMSVTLALWTGRINNISSLFDAVLILGRMPSDVYRGAMSVILTLVLPIAAIATLPSKALLGILEPAIVPYQLVLTTVLLWLSHWFWNFSLRRYTSASS
jgi:ABC-2 type transport system permease protein